MSDLVFMLIISTLVKLRPLDTAYLVIGSNIVLLKGSKLKRSTHSAIRIKR